MATKIVNRAKLLRKLRNLPPQVRAEMKVAIQQSAGELVAMQKSLAPSDTGALRNSIEAHFGGVQKMRGQVGGGLPAGDPELTVAVTAGGPDTFYARFVEFGTSERTAGGRFAGATIPAIPPQPFFYPAFRALRRRIRSRISRASGKAARRVAAS